MSPLFYFTVWISCCQYCHQLIQLLKSWYSFKVDCLVQVPVIDEGVFVRNIQWWSALNLFWYLPTWALHSRIHLPPSFAGRVHVYHKRKLHFLFFFIYDTITYKILIAIYWIYFPLELFDIAKIKIKKVLRIQLLIFWLILFFPQLMKLIYKLMEFINLVPSCFLTLKEWIPDQAKLQLDVLICSCLFFLIVRKYLIKDTKIKLVSFWLNANSARN